MHQGNKFTRKSFAVNGDWYTPLNTMKNEYKSIVYGEYVNTSSSCGDWEGFIIQKLGKTYYGIPFWQENLHHEIGFFSVDTGDVECTAATEIECRRLMETWYAMGGLEGIIMNNDNTQ